MKKVLLVEDDPFLIEIYKKKLENNNYEVIVANSGAKAISSLKEKKFDVMILDIVLPEMEGWQVLEKARKELGLSKMKIIILSNLGQKEEIEKGLKLGADKYLIKAHYTPSQLVEEISKILSV